MMQRVDILKSGFSELEEIAEIERECIPGGWSLKGLREWYANENTVIFSAVCDGERAGFANGSWVLDEGELLNIAVKNDYRRRGIAKMLYKRLEEFFLEQGVAAVFLEVREQNAPAAALYEGNGFVKIGLRKNYYKNPADNAVLMKKKIKNW